MGLVSGSQTSVGIKPVTKNASLFSRGRINGVMQGPGIREFVGLDVPLVCYSSMLGYSM